MTIDERTIAQRIVRAAAARCRVPVEEAMLTHVGAKGRPMSAYAKTLAACTVREYTNLPTSEISTLMGSPNPGRVSRYISVRCRERYPGLMDELPMVWEMATKGDGPIIALPKMSAQTKMDDGIDEAIRERLAAGVDPRAPNPQAIGRAGAVEAVTPDFQISIVRHPKAARCDQGPRVQSSHDSPAGAIPDAVAVAVAALDFAIREMERLGWPEDQTREALAPLLDAIRKVDRRLMSVVI